MRFMVTCHSLAIPAHGGREADSKRAEKAAAEAASQAAALRKEAQGVATAAEAEASKITAAAAAESRSLLASAKSRRARLQRGHSLRSTTRPQKSRRDEILRVDPCGKCILPVEC